MRKITIAIVLLLSQAGFAQITGKMLASKVGSTKTTTTSTTSATTTSTVTEATTTTTTTMEATTKRSSYAMVRSSGERNPFTFVTPNKDTLFLLRSEPLSALTEKIWKEHPQVDDYGKAPVMIYVDVLPIVRPSTRKQSFSKRG